MPFHLMPSLSNSVGIARRLDEFAKFLLTLHVDNNYCELTNYDDTNVSDCQSSYMRLLRLPHARTGTSLPGMDHPTSSPEYLNNPCNRDNWATTVSPNPNVKVFIGAPASSSAAGSGYVDASTIATIIEQTSSEYSSFGGVMLWDMSQAYGSSFPETDQTLNMTSRLIWG